jgi:hypothetical protein
VSEYDHIDRILSPWRHEGSIPSSAEAAETRLLSAGPTAGSVQLTPEALPAAASCPEGRRGEANADVSLALKDSEHVDIGRNLQRAKAVEHVHERWGESSSTFSKTWTNALVASAKRPRTGMKPNRRSPRR